MGRLQALLKEEVIKRLGKNALITNRSLVSFKDQGDEVQVTLQAEDKQLFKETGEFLIGADGLNSAVRNQLYPDQGSPHFAGLMLWRGATVGRSFLSGSTMIMAGHRDQKVVVYPISNVDESGRQLINWVAEFRVPEDTIHRDGWSNVGELHEFADRFSDWKFAWLDLQALFQNAEQIYKFPMVDRDPIKQWSFGRVTLAGDAAHAMYPNGSNGASQGILDAVSLGKHMKALTNIETAFAAYEQERLPPTTQLIHDNRQTGPERVLQLVKDRCDGSCGQEHSCVPHAELEEIANAYKKLAGFDKASVNVGDIK